MKKAMIIFWMKYFSSVGQKRSIETVCVETIEVNEQFDKAMDIFRKKFH